jgi:alpha-glucosidase
MKQIIISLLTGIYCLPVFSEEQTVSSPDGKLQMKIYTKGENVRYTVNYGAHPVVLESLLGINGNGEWKDGMVVGQSVNTTVDETWKPLYGERNTVRDHYNQSEIDLAQANDSRRSLKLIVRAYNEGIAFRYFFTGNDYLHITDEYTQYTMPEGTRAYFTPAAQTEYSLLPLKNWPGECERPLVLELPQGPYVLLTEAEMVNYARTKFVLAPGKANTIIGRMYGAVDDIAPYKTPWRVIMAADKPGRLIENNDLLLNLNPPCVIDNTWWITPGKVMREGTRTTAGAKTFVDFAVKRNMQYIHFDAGWYGDENSKEADATKVSIDPILNPNPNALDLKEVIAYAKKHKLKVILYVNQRALAQQLDEILPLYKSWGVDGIKFGFVHVGSQHWTTWLHEAVRKCAQYGIVLNIHDEYRPTGFSRTYPNLMTQEGIFGNEEFPDATHNVTLPFTRFTQGAADYTIPYFRWTSYSKVPEIKRLRNTPAHQMAMAVVFYSPLQYIYWGDSPSDSQDEPELEFFDRVPTVWDDTKVIHGEIGKYITMARRSGDDWFVGTMTNNDGRKLGIPLDFLPEGKTFTAHVYDDDPKVKTRTRVGVKTVKVTNNSVIEANLQPSGGQAIWIENHK